jgi:NADH dehydrogenase FAD-containing subunit
VEELTPPRLPIGALVQRVLDTAEDAYLHLKRLPYEFDWAVEPPKVEGKRRRETVVVLGTGWAAHALLKTIDTNLAKVVVVSPINHFVFTPMLASAAVGTVEYRSMTEAIRACNPLIDSYLEGRAVRVDVRQKILTVQMTELLQPTTTSSGSTTMLKTTIDLSYDRLIVAVGCKSADSLVPGAAEFALFLKTCDDARRLRTAVGEALELACRPEGNDSMAAAANHDDEEARLARRRQKLLTFAIIGGGPTGVELVGELADFVRDVTRPRSGVYSQLRGQVRLVLLHGGQELVPQFDPELRQHAYRALTTAGVDVRLNVRVDQVGPGFVKYTSKGGGGGNNDPAERQQQTLDVGLAVFAAGTEAVPFVRTLLEQLPASARGAQGKIQVDGFLRCPVPDGAEMGSILVMGDAASFCTTDPVNNNNNSFLPQTAQVAGQQGAYVARLLNRNYDLTTTVPQLRPGAALYLKLRGLDRAAPCT